MKKAEKNAKMRKVLTVTVENFAAIRETLKSETECRVNDKVTLIGFLPNTERLSDNGKKVRTPFYYLAEDGTKYTSTTLKNLLGLECETKGERKTTTFASVWEQLEKLADTATAKELQDAAKVLQEKAKAKAKAEAEERAAQIAALEAQLAALRG